MHQADMQLHVHQADVSSWTEEHFRDAYQSFASRIPDEIMDAAAAEVAKRLGLDALGQKQNNGVLRVLVQRAMKAYLLVKACSTKADINVSGRAHRLHGECHG
jgi:hypothetical protein